MRREFGDNLIASFLAISILIAPVLSLQSARNISSYGMIKYGNPCMKWLRTDGKWIVDSEGNIVILRGANFMGYEFGAWESHTEEDYAKMASWGFNVVRLPIAWHYIEPQPGFYNSSYFERHVDRDIAWAKKYGIYIILDMHQWRWSPHFDFDFYGKHARGNGMPIWLVSLYPNTPQGLGQAVTDFLLGTGPNGTIASETNPSMRDRFVDVWKYVASRYVNETTILGYDLLNELPPPNRFDPQGINSALASNYLYPLYQELIDEIRKIDRNHIIFYEPINVHNMKDARLLNHSNAVFSFHYYGYSTNYGGNLTELENDIVNNFLSLPENNPIRNWSIPIQVGEFGIDDTAQNAELYVKHILTIFEKYQLTYIWWTYYRSDTYAKSMLRSDWSERTHVQYLDRPYPIVLTLPPRKLEFDYDKKSIVAEFLFAGDYFVKIYISKRHFPAFKVSYDAEIPFNEDFDEGSRILNLQFVSNRTLMITISPI